MKIANPISYKLFNIYLMFTREPFVKDFSQELEFYSNGNGGLLGLISLDLTDNDYTAIIFSRDISKQYREERIEVSFLTIQEARDWIEKSMGDDTIVFHDNKSKYFDLFTLMDNQDQINPNFVFLRDNVALEAAKETISEVSYHYKDIDGNFIEQFQSLNGFDARVWELYLYTFFREQFFSFERNHEAPDYIIEKHNYKMAVEAVVVARKTPISEILNPKSIEQIESDLKNGIPLMFGSALFDKVKKQYWNQEHVQGLPFIIAIADFHDSLSMTWTFSALLEYLYGLTFTHSFDKNGKLDVQAIEVGNYTKPNGTEIPSGFFFQDGNEDVSAILFSSCGTISKFNRIGKQVGFGNKKSKLFRHVSFHDHTPNATKPKFVTYEVNEDCEETWTEGVVIYHNPNAKIPLVPEIFEENVAQCFYEDGKLINYIPDVFPYSSLTNNIVSQG